MHLDFTAETSSDDVVERSFTVGDVPGVLWSPAPAVPGAPLLLMGHGGGLHERAPGLEARAPSGGRARRVPRRDDRRARTR